MNGCILPRNASMEERDVQDAVNLVARVLLAYIFVVAGWGKLAGYSGTEQYFVSMGLSAWMVAPTILIELGGGLLLVFGALTRPTALVLAAFCVATAALVHWHPGDQAQMINFMKNIAMTGGFLFVFLHGAGRWSLDHALAIPWRGAAAS